MLDLELQGKLQRPVIPNDCQHNGHIYYLLLNSLEHRTHFIAELKSKNIQTVFHYIPLHDSPAGAKMARYHSDMINSTLLSERLIRLPLWLGIESYQDYIIEQIIDVL